MMSENKKCSFDCKTTKTPLWRVEPAGPKVIFPSTTLLIFMVFVRVFLKER
jgi:hypothetical protein